MRIALAQILSDADPEATARQVRTHIASAAARGVEVVVFPEAAMARFGTKLAPLAQPLDGAWATAVTNAATEYGVQVVAGMFEPEESGTEHPARVYNTLLNTAGEPYRKIHLFDAFGFAESDTVAPGATPVSFTYHGVHFGLATCYDLRFPELFRSLGADVILVPASWGAGEGKLEQWRLLVRARAIDSGAWVLACDQADPGAEGVEVSSKAPTGIGHSLVADPWGRVHAEADAGTELLVVDIDVSMAAKARAAMGQLANRRLT